MRIILILAALLSGIVHADDNRMAWTATALLVADWGQTRHISRSNDFHERNPLLGRNPSTGTVDRYFTGVIIGTWAIHKFMPKPWNKRIVLGITVMQAGVVAHNASIGVRMEF